MALILTGLGQLGTAGGNNLFYYRTADAAATVAGASYFNNAANILNVGDVILAITGVGGTIVPKIYMVLTNTGSAVTVGMPAGLT
jgi:hypothetical protein